MSEQKILKIHFISGDEMNFCFTICSHLYLALCVLFHWLLSFCFLRWLSLNLLLYSIFRSTFKFCKFRILFFSVLFYEILKISENMTTITKNEINNTIKMTGTLQQKHTLEYECYICHKSIKNYYYESHQISLCTRIVMTIRMAIWIYRKVTMKHLFCVSFNLIAIFDHFFFIYCKNSFIFRWCKQYAYKI